MLMVIPCSVKAAARLRLVNYLKHALSTSDPNSGSQSGLAKTCDCPGYNLINFSFENRKSYVCLDLESASAAEYFI